MFNPFRRSNQTSEPVQLIAPASDQVEETRDAPPNDPFAWAEGLIAPPTIAGPEVSPATSLECAPVRACVDIIAGLLGTLPLNLYKPAADGGTEAVESHPAIPLIREDANPWTAASELRTALTADALLWGAGYGLVLRDSDGIPTEIHRLPPWCVVVIADPFTMEPTFEVSVGGSVTGKYTCRDIVYIRPIVKIDNLATAGFQTGLAPIKTGRQAIGLALAMERHAAQIMHNGGRPSGILKFPGKPTATALQLMKTAWKAMTSGRAAGGTAILTDGAEFQQIAFTSVDNQFLELRQFQILEIARLFGVPPAFLQEMGRATYNNFEASSREFVKLTLLPWCRTWEAALRRTLLTDANRKRGLTFGYDLDGLLEGDLVARAGAYSTLISSKVINPNEARAKEGMAAYEGGEKFSNPSTTPGAPDTPKPAQAGPDTTGVDSPR